MFSSPEPRQIDPICGSVPPVFDHNRNPIPPRCKLLAELDEWKQEARKIAYHREVPCGDFELVFSNLRIKVWRCKNPELIKKPVAYFWKAFNNEINTHLKPPTRKGQLVGVADFEAVDPESGSQFVRIENEEMLVWVRSKATPKQMIVLEAYLRLGCLYAVAREFLRAEGTIDPSIASVNRLKATLSKCYNRLVKTCIRSRSQIES